MQKFKLTFYGGVGSVTGVNFLLEALGKKFLIDAGLTIRCIPSQTMEMGDTPYDIEEIDGIFISHADLGHMGKLPVLIKNGFRGNIYSTKETKLLSEIFFNDCLSGFKEGLENFSEEDVAKTILLWKTFSYGENIDLGEEISLRAYDAGHMLGSAIFEFKYNDKNLLFVNSLGVSFVPGLSGMDLVNKVDYMVIESVYGNKINETELSRRSYLEDFIEDAITRKGGVLIPISSVDKIYVILSDIYNLINNGKIPKISIIVDSSLAYKAKKIYSKLFRCEEGQCSDLDQFSEKFGDLKIVENGFGVDEIMKSEENTVVIVGAGNSSSKRLGDYYEKFVSNPNNLIAFLDYQMEGSEGRKLQEGTGNINIAGKNIKVLSQIESITSYSSHADSNRLFKFVDEYKESLKKVFVVIGESNSSKSLATKLRDYIGVNAKVSERGETYELDF